MGSTLTEINMVTVSVTTCVKILRSVGIHQASAIWITQQTTSRLANVDGPAEETVATMIPNGEPVHDVQRGHGCGEPATC